MTFGDKLPLDIISKHCKDLKAVMLFLLGVTDKKGKVVPIIQDGCEGWFHVSPDIE
jgi:hypothetical protein